VTAIARRVALKALCVWGATTATGTLAAAEAYPDRPVKIIAPFVAGGGTDILGRLLAAKLSAAFGQSFIVENKAGATGSIGAEYVAKATPDGYTLLLGSNAPNAIDRMLYRDLPYDPKTDFEPVSLLARAPNVLLVGPSMHARSVSELIAFARMNPGKLTFASAGVGSPAHLAGELFKSMAHIDIRHVPYKGGGAALTDLLAGRVDMMFGDQLLAVTQMKSRKLAALAVTTAKRSAALPDLPTIAEAALPGYDTGLWYGLFAPKGTARETVMILNAQLKRLLGTHEVQESIARSGAQASASSPEELEALVVAEIAKWRGLAKTLDLKLSQ
jgi:tripartite-type tricarboxylate transporter receptor subunit TctC